MQEKCKLKIKAIPAVDARPTKEGSKPAQHNFDVEAASPGCRLGLGRWFALPKGPIGVEGKGGREFVWLAAGMGVPGPTANGKGQLQGLEPHVSPGSHTPNAHLAGRVSAFSTPQSTHTHAARSKPTLARPYGKEATTQQHLSAGFSPRARRCGRPCGTSICGVHLHMGL